MDKAGKQVVINEVKETFAGVMSIVLADFRGMDVASISELREEFRKAGCGYRVIKNTLVKLAIKDTDMEVMSEHLKGPTAVIWSTESPADAAKIAVNYAKTNKKFVIKGGYFEGESLDLAGVNQLSKMPDKPQSQSNLLMTFIAAPQNFVRTTIAGPQNFLYLLAARERSLNS
ncbi:MAG: 50S ribosomal protein L10 [Kofleriaceae bacterium]|nr:50S ribosomal protein L10 [Kofleriaceae bacterium]